MCDGAVMKDPQSLEFVLDHFKAQGMCDKAVEVGRSPFQYVLNWNVTQQEVKLWQVDDDFYGDNELIKSYDSYQKRKTQKAKFKEELLPITWHPSRWQDWCISEDEKKETEKLWR